MAIEAQLADGRILEFPDGTDPSVIQATVKRLVAQSAQPKESTIGSELVRGGKQLVSSARTGAESLFDKNKAATEGVARSEAIAKEAGEGASFEALQKAYEKDGVLGALKELPSQASRGLAGQAANLATIYAGSKAGAAAGAPFGTRGRIVGGAAGAAGALLPQFMGQTVQTQAAEQMERGEPVDIDRTKAYTAAAGMAALEGAGTAFTLGKRVVKGILGIADDAALVTAKSQAELVKAAERSLAASAGRGVVRGTAEIPVEVGQEIIDRYQSGQDLTSPEAIKAYGEAAYQAALIGGTVGGISGPIERSQARGQVEQQKQAAAAANVPPPPEPEPEIVPGAKLRQDAPAGTQGTLFTRKEMGSKIPAQKEVPEPPSAAVQQGEQQTLGLDFQRDYADLSAEREALRAQPRTAEVRTRIAELTEQMASYDEATTGQRQAEEIIKAERDAKKAKKAVVEPPVVEPPVAAPVVTGITQADIDAIGLPLRTSKQWVQDNVIGKTVEELQALVQREPNLINNKGARAEVLKALIAPQPKAFEEKPNVPTTTQTDQSQGELDLGGGEPSVGVSGKPTGTDVVQPGAGVPAPTGAPATPDGLGLAPAGQPAGTGTQAKGTPAPAVTTPVKRTSNQVQDEIRTLIANQQALLTKAGRIPAIKSPARTKWDAISVQIDQKKAEWAELDRAERLAKGTNAPTTTTAATGAPATTTTTAGPKTTTGRTTKTTTPKTTQAPAPAVATETVEEEAARKAEAEEIKRRLDDLERQQKEAKVKTEKPAPKVEKAEPKELPEKLREPVGTSEYGMEEGETEILRGPQGMLFPMSKREELDYAKKKEKPEIVDLIDASEIEELPPAGQQKLDFTKKPEPEPEPEPEPVQAKPDPTRIGIEPTWSSVYARPLTPIVYEDNDFCLIRQLNRLNQPRFYAINRSGIEATYPVHMKDKQPNWLAGTEYDRLRAAADSLSMKEVDLAINNSDGPFSKGNNIVGADAVDPAMVGYTENILKSLGLGDLRIFLFSKPNATDTTFVDKHKLYGRYAAIAEQQESRVNGAAVNLGIDGKTYGIYLRPGMTEGKQLEVLAHEIGHIVQAHLYDNASTAEQKAITDEYLAWRKKAKVATTRDLMYMLRNREDAETNVKNAEFNRDADKPASQVLKEFDSYWISFSEWFADNVSRWATTNDKPLSIADKFFAKTAQMMRDLVAIVTGRKFPPAKSVADFLNKAGPANFRPLPNISLTANEAVKKQFSTSYTPQDVVNSMGPLTPLNERSLKQMVFGMQNEGDPTRGVKFRVAAVDSAAAIDEKFSRTFNGAVRDSLGKINPMGLYRQAQDYSKILLEYFQNGTLVKDKDTGLYRTIGTGKGAPADVFPLIYAWGEKTGRSKEQAEQFASRVLEAKRLDEVLKVNPDFPKHIKDRERAILVAEYNSDPVYAEMNAAMDKPRLALIDKMVEVGRLSKETAAEWKSVVGYVPFDRIGDFTDKFSTVKKTTGRSPLALTKDPELVGSFTRPVGNVFENYLNTMGWMVGQTMNNDARIQTLRGLEDLGFTGKASRIPGTEGKTAKAYVNGEVMYWTLPSRYDVAAFQDLNPPKMAIMRTLGAFSNILRKSVTILPPFALKQVTDDVQRAMLTSGVKNPGALLRMTLANFGKIAVAELRGIQHPIVKEFGALGLTGEYDFEAGKPAVSLLKDLGYRERTVAGSKLLGTLLHRLDGITRASDLAVRKAIYDQTLKESNNDRLLAQSRAREFINFRRRGASEIVAIGTATIPFFNAYMQGMDVLYRAASGKDSSSSVGRAQARQLFWSRAGTVIALSSLYALMSGDDEDYQDMDLRTRNSNWILPGGFKIPVPGELGAIFKVIPETVIEYLRRSGTPEEQTALEAIRSSLKFMSEQYIERTVPIPQAVKPLIEAWTNYSFFTGRELEGIYQKQQDPSMRVTSKTSELAQAISNFSRDVIGVDAVSPIQIDNMLSGYFGSTAALVTMMTDSLLNPSRIDRPLHKYALLSNYMYDPIGTRSLTEFYDEREKVGKANNTLRQLMKTDMARAEKYANEHESELMLESAVNSTLEQLERTRAYRKFLNSPDGAADMSKAEREKDLEELKKMEVEFTGWLREAKAELRKAQ
jgi:hypothetical protein